MYKTDIYQEDYVYKFFIRYIHKEIQSNVFNLNEKYLSLPFFLNSLPINSWYLYYKALQNYVERTVFFFSNRHLRGN